MQQMEQAHNGVKRFDFFSLRDFSASAEEPPPQIEIAPVIEEAPPPPPPPTFSEKELDTAKTQAREEGYHRGLEEGSLRARRADADQEVLLMGVMKQACEAVTAFRAEYEQQIETQKEVLTRLAVAVAKHVAGAAMRTAPEVPVSHMISECLPMLLAEPRIVITIHPSIIARMKDRLEEVGRQAGYDGTLILEPDDTLNPADCHIQWRGGSAHSSLEDTWRIVEEKLMQTPATGDN